MKIAVLGAPIEIVKNRNLSQLYARKRSVKFLCENVPLSFNSPYQKTVT